MIGETKSLCATCIFGLSMRGNAIQRIAKVSGKPEFIKKMMEKNKPPENPYLEELRASGIGEDEEDFEDEEDEIEIVSMSDMTEVKYEDRLSPMVMNHCFWPHDYRKGVPEGTQSLALADCYIGECSRYQTDTHVNQMEV